MDDNCTTETLSAARTMPTTNTYETLAVLCSDLLHNNLPDPARILPYLILLTALNLALLLRLPSRIPRTLSYQSVPVLSVQYRSAADMMNSVLRSVPSTAESTLPQEGCPICKADLTRPVRLPCQHPSCDACIRAALSQHNDCPPCTLNPFLPRPKAVGHKDNPLTDKQYIRATVWWLSFGAQCFLLLTISSADVLKSPDPVAIIHLPGFFGCLILAVFANTARNPVITTQAGRKWEERLTTIAFKSFGWMMVPLWCEAGGQVTLLALPFLFICAAVSLWSLLLEQDSDEGLVEHLDDNLNEGLWEDVEEDPDEAPEEWAIWI